MIEGPYESSEGEILIFPIDRFETADVCLSWIRENVGPREAEEFEIGVHPTDVSVHDHEEGDPCGDPCAKAHVVTAWTASVV